MLADQPLDDLPSHAVVELVAIFVAAHDLVSFQHGHGEYALGFGPRASSLAVNERFPAAGGWDNPRCCKAL